MVTFYNLQNMSNNDLEYRVQRIIENAKYCGLHTREATRQIFAVLNDMELNKKSLNKH